ncbi:MAG: LL-diaminopimelate aminotransferase [Omnitrophica bacterium RIFCSPLOWO2_02_FULL_45_16]|nr:MAG: LL-diaminopimelate aminotransferase [Omnitrophica bacterium RIFCSPHIGHO2_02_FULL_46_20]OGX01050.1 MAG: LL-diaminopimelate aminotransferase [Omnitrophica bacterium RIFCSPLOWO2_02_FULL_45_16]
MQFEKSDRLKKLPPYLFVEIDKAKKKARDEGCDIIDLGIGDPDMPTPAFVIKALSKAVKDPSTHRYSLDQGMPEFRYAAAKWLKKRFGVDFNPEGEIYPLIGSKEGIAHIPLAFINPGEAVLVPDPCYPPYRSGTIFAGGEIIYMPLSEKNKFLPDLKAINHHLLHKARMIFINYPNNPTAAICDKKFLRDVVNFAKRHNLIVCSDAAYSEITFDGYTAPSIFEAEGAKDVAIEFHSLSKTFNMTGWRIGFACGNASIIEGLANIKSNIDSGIFSAIQRAGITALDNYDKHIKSVIKIYEERRDILVQGLNAMGLYVENPKATFYVWVKVPPRYTSATFAKALLERCDIVATPGNGFGEHGEGYIRMAATVDKKRIKEAVDRIKKRLA